MTAPARVLVFDTSHLAAEVLTRALQEWHEVTPPIDLAPLLPNALEIHKPTMAVLRIPTASADDVLRLVGVVREAAGVRAVVMGPGAHSQLHHRCLDAGASAYLHAESELIELRLAIETVREGGRYLSPSFRAIEDSPLLRPRTPFSRMERRGLKLRQQGKTNSQIAVDVKRSVKTVEKRFTSMRIKLGMVGRRDLDWNRVDCR